VVRGIQIGLLLLLVSGSASAIAELALENGWVRMPPDGVSTLAIYGELTNSGDSPLTVATWSLDNAGMVMVHRSELNGGRMQMRSAGPLTVPARGKLVLQPQGLHIMVMKFNAEIGIGDEIVIKAMTESSESFSLTAAVVPINAIGPTLP
jgi:copper(I)-binding protein